MRLRQNKITGLLSLLLAFTVLTSCANMSSVAAPAGISLKDHEALARHYESLAKDAVVRLQENKKVLQEYEEHPYYFGRQGLDIHSHAAANVREYEKTLRESQIHADFHKKMAMELKGVSSNAQANQDRNFTSDNSEQSVNQGL